MTATAGPPVPTRIEEPRVPFVEQVKSFRAPFWAAQVMEMIERLAYYGVRVVVPIYIASSEDPGGLHFTNAEKGTIFTVWAVVQTLLPMFTGGYADRYGRKSTIAASIAIKIAGYLLMATQRSFWGFFLGCQVLATGTAIFKPGVQGTLVRGTNRSNSSVGWGIFYQMVNIGGFLGPPLAGFLHHYAWKWVFLSCAAIVSLNFVTLLTYDDSDPPGELSAGAKAMAARSPLQVLGYSVKNIFRARLISFILVMSAFWLMFMQLYDALPNFIEEWTDSRDLVAALGLHEGQLARMTPRGLQVPQEWMINLDAGLIVLFMIPVAALTARIKRLRAIFIGIFIASSGLLLAGVTTSGAFCLTGIAVFAFGEMAASPKMNEYLGVIAPKGEEALYMGYANVPYAIGWSAADLFGGVLYDKLADKANLAIRYLREHQLVATDALDKLERTKAMATLQDAAKLDPTQATKLLWDTYHPYTFWYLFVAIGLAGAVGMVIYARIAARWSVENA